MLHRILLIANEDTGHQDGIRRFLSPERGFECKLEVWNPDSPPPALQSSDELVLFVAGQSCQPAVSFFHWLRQNRINNPVVAILPRDCEDTVLRPAAQVVDDFIFSPIKDEELQCRLERILGPNADEELQVRQRLKQELGLAQLVGEDPEFLRAVRQIPAIAASTAPALLLGETGTGKELCAQAIHALSVRHAGPFIPVECGALPENLVENELFGHMRGAFTDAHCDQKGLAAMADGGTLFLDEIDSLPLAAQAKLLRFIQEGTYRPLGSQKFLRADLRLIAAANRDLEQCVRDGQFRSDLFFRLNVLPLHLPALRQRRGDIATLARHFLSLLAPSEQPEKKLSRAALRALESYEWPGNVRELYNTLQRAVAFSQNAPVLPIHLGLPVAPGMEKSSFQKARLSVIENFEKGFLEEMLRKSHGNVTRAAVAAGKDRRVFGRLMKRYNIDRRAYT